MNRMALTKRRILGVALAILMTTAACVRPADGERPPIVPESAATFGSMVEAAGDAPLTTEASSESSLVTTTTIERLTARVVTTTAPSLTTTTSVSPNPGNDPNNAERAQPTDRVGDISMGSYRFTSALVITEAGTETTGSLHGEADGSGGYHYIYEPDGAEVIETRDRYWRRLDGEWSEAEPPSEAAPFGLPDRYKSVYYMFENVMDVAEQVGTEPLGDGLATSHWHLEGDGQEPDGSQYHQFVDVWLDELSDGYHVVRKATWGTVWPDDDWGISYEWEFSDLGAEIVIEPPIP